MESVWMMSESKVLTPLGEIPKESLTAVVEVGPDMQQAPAVFTLRVKPDRRREQRPIPAELDRRRAR
jgi:hypothetical protein